MSARVLWVTKGLGLGGAERLLTSTAAGIDPSRFAVEVGYLLPWKDAFVPDLARHGVAATCLGARHTLDPRWVRRLRRLVHDDPPDLVHTHSPVPAAAVRMLRAEGVRLVHTEHNVWPRYRWPTLAANAATWGRNDAVIAVSDGVADSIAPPRWVSPAPPVEVLHHGVDVARAPRGPRARAAARRDLGIPDEVPVVGNVANLTPKKDHAGLLAAVDRLRHQFPDLVVLVVGSGPLEGALRADARGRGLEGHVRFLGSRDDVLDLLPALDAFVLSSRFEGLPISLLEAMAAGVVPVATRVGGIPEAVDDGRTGRLVEPGDPRALAAALSDVLADPPARATMAAAATAEVGARFGIERAVDRIQAIYDDVLDRVAT